MKLARTVRLDISDQNVFDQPAESGEWAISGGFEFSNWSEVDLKGKAKQAFSNGWYSVESGGRASFVSVCAITEAELDAVKRQLAQTFVEIYGAPSIEAAMPVAIDEVEVTRFNPCRFLVAQSNLTSKIFREFTSDTNCERCDIAICKV